MEPVNPSPGLSPAQLAALEHVGRVGSELAAQSLSRILGRPLELATTAVRLLPLREVSEALGGAETEVAGVHLRIQGGAAGQILFVIPREPALAMTHMMYAPGEVGGEASPRVGIGLTLFADVLASSLLNALSGATRLPLYASPQETTRDMAGAVVSQLLAEASEHSEAVLLYACRFQWEELSVNTHWLLVPEPASLRNILEALGIPDGGHV